MHIGIAPAAVNRHATVNARCRLSAGQRFWGTASSLRTRSR